MLCAFSPPTLRCPQLSRVYWQLGFQHQSFFELFVYLAIIGFFGYLVFEIKKINRAMIEDDADRPKGKAD